MKTTFARTAFAFGMTVLLATRSACFSGAVVGTLDKPWYQANRLYGPNKELFEKTWKLPDAEKVK